MARRSRERFGVIGLAAFIVITVAVYLALKSSVLESTFSGHLLPYQALVANPGQLRAGDVRRDATAVRRARERPRGGGALARRGRTAGRSPYGWTRTGEGLFVNYLARPSADVSEAAWLIVIQEPDPQAPPDPAPNDETHRRLPDGTILHVTFWTHRFGGQVAPGFVRQPETQRLDPGAYRARSRGAREEMNVKTVFSNRPLAAIVLPSLCLWS